MIELTTFGSNMAIYIENEMIFITKSTNRGGFIYFLFFLGIVEDKPFFISNTL